MPNQSVNSQVLVLYGVPARMPLFSVTGRPLQKTFELTSGNKRTFEPALRDALITFMTSDAVVRSARFVFVRNATEFSFAIHANSYSHVIYYGHALEGVNALLPTVANRITAADLAQSLRGTDVEHFDILGCSSSGIAAELSQKFPKIRIGYLRTKRVDDIVCDPKTLQVLKMKIDHQAILHFGAVGR